VREADAVGGKTAAEQLTIDRMKAAAAQRAGDMGTAIQALESMHGKVGGAEQGRSPSSWPRPMPSSATTPRRPSG
jgi:hypothetical protein